MKRYLLIVFFALLASAGAQTVRTLGYNTNGVVVYTNTNTLTLTNANSLISQVLIVSNNVTVGNLTVGTNRITFRGTNSGFDFSAGASATQIRTNIGLSWDGLTNTDAAGVQSAMFAATTTNSPTNTNAPVPDAWVDLSVGTNTFKLPLWK